MYDDEYEYRQERQYLAAEREDQQTRVLMAAVYGDDEADDEEEEEPPDDWNEGPSVEDYDDPDEQPPAGRDGPLPTSVQKPDPVQDVLAVAAQLKASSDTAGAEIVRRRKAKAKGPKKSRLKPRPQAKTAAKAAKATKPKKVSKTSKSSKKPKCRLAWG